MRSKIRDQKLKAIIWKVVFELGLVTDQNLIWYPQLLYYCPFIASLLKERVFQ